MSAEPTRTIEASLVGLMLGLVQTGLGLSLVQHAATTVALVWAVPATWLLGGALAARLATEARTTGLLVLATFAVPTGRLVLGVFPFERFAVAIVLLAGACAGAFAGSFLAARARSWPNVAELLMRENDGFVLGAVLGLGSLFVDARLADGVSLLLALVLLVLRFRVKAGRDAT